MIRFNSVAALFLALTAVGVHAQSIPRSTRAMALGNSFVLGSSDASAIFYNPASLAAGAGLAVHRRGEAFSDVTLAAGTSSGSRILGIGLAATTASGAAHQTAVIGLATELFGFGVGVAVRYDDRAVGAVASAKGGLDVGVMREVAFVTFGASARGLSTTDSVVDPVYTIAATTSSAEIGPLDFVATTSVSGSDDPIGSAGIELSYWPVQGRTVAVRLGSLRDADGDYSVSFGVGAVADALTFEYAYQDGAVGGHRFGIRWR